MLSNSNSAATVAGRNDPDNSEELSTSAIVSRRILISDSAVSTSFIAATVLPRFEILSNYHYLLSHPLGFPCGLE